MLAPHAIVPAFFGLGVAWYIPQRTFRGSFISLAIQTAHQTMTVFLHNSAQNLISLFPNAVALNMVHSSAGFNCPVYLTCTECIPLMPLALNIQDSFPLTFAVIMLRNVSVRFFS
jgi:hypothetical protein